MKPAEQAGMLLGSLQGAGLAMYQTELDIGSYGESLSGSEART